VARTRVWIVVAPVVAAGLLTAHALAYRLTSTSTDPFHAYLEHAPQVLLVLLLCGAALGGFGTRRNAPPAYAFPLVALATFVVQEHLERIVHGSGLPILVTSPAFILGLALQVPVAMLAWVLARWLLDVVQETGWQRTLRPRFDLGLVASPLAAVGRTEIPIPHGRGPPTPLLSR
jgi:hypothetical protein